MTRVPDSAVELAAGTLLAHMLDTSANWSAEGDLDGPGAARVLARLMLEAVAAEGLMAPTSD
jgi:hypothetical protein